MRLFGLRDDLAEDVHRADANRREKKFKILTSDETWKTQSRPRWELYAFLAVIHLFPQVGSARSKRQFHPIQQNLRLLRLMQVSAWTEFPLSIYGIWSLTCYIFLQPEHGETRGITNQISYTSHKMIQNWSMAIMCPHKRNLLSQEPGSTFLKKTKQ